MTPGVAGVVSRKRIAAGKVLLCCYILGVVAGGFLLRAWTWKTSADIHYADDIQNGLFWGKQVLQVGRSQTPGGGSADTWLILFKGYVSIYNRPDIHGYPHPLDYPPLRLLIMSCWAKYEDGTHAGKNIDVIKNAGPLCCSSTRSAN